jgi:hypothetical protein
MVDPQLDKQHFDELLRRALATKPISNEEIVRRSKEGGSKAAPSRS